MPQNKCVRWSPTNEKSDRLKVAYVNPIQVQVYHGFLRCQAIKLLETRNSMILWEKKVLGLGS